MKIANPIYDIVFKYLMEDNEIAIALLSAILGEEIIKLEMRPQETIIESENAGLNVLRFDFKAEIQLSNNKTKKVLIELQKAKRIFDIMRFRRYLGINYSTADKKANEKDEVPTIPLPIITIYFLGFELDNISAPVVRVARYYQNALTNEHIDEKEDFIELLTHDSYVVQIPHLKASVQTKIENFLQIFSSDFKTDDRHQLDFTGSQEEPIVKKMITKLSRAISDSDVRRMMDVEDEIEGVFKRGYAEKDKEIEAQRLRADAAEQRAETERLEKEELLRKAETERLEKEELLRKAETERLEKEELLRKAETQRLEKEQLLKEIEILKQNLKKE